MINLEDIKNNSLLFDNHYRLINKIGGGGFSEVWLAHDTIADMDVALKIYKPSGALDEEGKNDFKKEFARLCELNHSNIIHAIGFGIHKDELPYLAMRVCKNGSAKKLIGNVKEDELWDFIEQVTSGIQYLHKREVVHQDLKPDNVLIDSDGQYLIIDFGISTKTRNTLRKSENGNVNIGGGTPWYMSIESYGKDAPSVYARDIWALGASLYEIMTGDVPFGQFGGLTQKERRGKIPPISQPFSNELKQLVYDCLALNAWDRPDADEILERVKQHKDGLHARPFPLSKLLAVLFVIVFTASCFEGWPYVKKYILGSNSQYSLVDSLYLSKLDESKSIIESEATDIINQNEAEKMSLNNICASFDSYSQVSYLLDSISSDAHKQAIIKLDSIRDIVDNLCVFFETRGQSKLDEYGEDFGEEAYQKYMSLKDTLKSKAIILTNYN